MILVKKLTKSDITIVKEVWEKLKREGHKGKQMAIVLPRKFMKRHGYEFSDKEQGFEIPLKITFCGPGNAGPIAFTDAAICRHSKDWRIHKCYIKPEMYSDGRFDSLETEDLFVFHVQINGGFALARACFLSHFDSRDDLVIAALKQNVTGATSEESLLRQALLSTGVSAAHHIFSVIQSVYQEPLEVSESGADELEAAIGGAFSLTGAFQLTQEELDERNEEAKRIGELGESFFNEWLLTCPLINGLKVLAHEWTSRSNAVSPYDFSIQLETGEWKSVEVKSTSGKHLKKMYISRGELEYMTEAGPQDVILARISDVDSDPLLRLAIETSDAAMTILDGATFPEGVEIVSIAINPEYFDFSNAVVSLSTNRD